MQGEKFSTLDSMTQLAAIRRGRNTWLRSSFVLIQTKRIGAHFSSEPASAIDLHGPRLTHVIQTFVPTLSHGAIQVLDLDRCLIFSVSREAIH
eukprot:scaffold1017_cov374-Prasinococcus_capsulatus_cf.AAC.16